MTDNIKLPPLPEGNVAHLIAAQSAEIEALRAEVDAMRREVGELRMSAKRRDQYVAEKVAQAADAIARAERLAEALRLIESAKDRGVWH